MDGTGHGATGFGTAGEMTLEQTSGAVAPSLARTRVDPSPPFALPLLRSKFSSLSCLAPYVCGVVRYFKVRSKYVF